MKKLIAFIKDLPRQWKAETPKVAKLIRNACGILGSSISSAYGYVVILNIDMPSWFGTAVGISVFICFLIFGAAGTKEKKDGKCK